MFKCFPMSVLGLVSSAPFLATLFILLVFLYRDRALHWAMDMEGRQCIFRGEFRGFILTLFYFI